MHTNANAALLVIDVQVAMFMESDPVHNAEGLLLKIGSLLKSARSSGTPIIYIQHNEK